MNNKNPFYRIQFYYTWLINNYEITPIDDSYDYGIPMIRLHEISNIPISIIRKDFLCMFQWQNSISLAINNDTNCQFPNWTTILEFDDTHPIYSELNNKYNLEDIFTQLMESTFPTKLEELILNGILDELPIYIDNPSDKPIYHIPLTQEESLALNAFHVGEAKLSVKYHTLNEIYEPLFKIKDSYLYNHHYAALCEKLDIINLAISQQACLKVKYKTAKNNILNITFIPLKIAYDSNENLYSVLSVYEEKVMVYRLDHILSIENCYDNIPIPSKDMLSIYPYVWGNCFSDTPYQVKVKFFNEANVWEKVKKELANRTLGKIYEHNNFLYYEDIVIGLSKFRSWIYGYGASAIVIEPKELQQQIIESLKQRQGE